MVDSIKKDFLDEVEDLNEEKKLAIRHNDSTIVIANPGTGKTKLLAYKYVYLLHQGISPKDILCLTFTEKACGEMQERILKLIETEKLTIDLTQINIQTFHAFALDNLEDNELISANSLRYEIYSYLIENQVLNYGDNYLLDTIVPKIETSIRYLKSFGITPDKIKIEDVKPYIVDFKTYNKTELETYLMHFINIFERYEKFKEKRGLDYTDILINFLILKNKPKFKWVLVDELQDVNDMEADIALSVCDKYVVVGDKKQAIFGFQGGSIGNFSKFSSAKEFILSDNFRSTDEILNYAKELFSSKTADKSNIDEIKDLKSADSKKGDKPLIISIKDNVPSYIGYFIKKLQMKEDKEIAIIARKNSQLYKFAKELEANGISFSSTYLTSSDEAKNNIIVFLKGLLSKDINLIKASMFTPFFPICLQDAFELAESNKLTIEEIYNKYPKYKDLRESINNINDLDNVFKNNILPVAVAYGRDYTLSCINMQKVTIEALDLLENKTIENLCNFLQSAEQLAEEIKSEKKVILTTVHKAKGKQYPVVIYVPSKTNDNENFQDAITTAILNTMNKNPKEELEEEPNRIDFVAITRAVQNLYIITSKSPNYKNEYAIFEEEQEPQESVIDFSDLNKKAFSLFVNKDYENAKKQLEDQNAWITDYITKYFEGLDHLSFSGIETDPGKYLEQKILKLKQTSKALIKGTNIHTLIEQILNNQSVDISTLDKETQKILENSKVLISEIKISYPEVFATELEFRNVSLKDITTISSSLPITGKIDAVFRNPVTQEYLIVDWKTDKDVNAYGSDHRQQLELYKSILSYTQNIPKEKIKVSIGYVSLSKRINDGTIDTKLDSTIPAKTAIGTLTKHIQVIVDWKSNPETFIKALESINHINQTPITRAIIEQYRKEKKIKEYEN